MTYVPRPVRSVRRCLPKASAGLSAVLCAVLLGPALAACASSTGPDGTKAAPVHVDDTAAARSGAGSAPAVTGATDLKAKPTIAAGSGTPPARLVTRDLVVGTGAAASPTSTVSVQYVGVLWVDGKEFDSSWKGGQPVIFPLDGVIPGFQQGIGGMKIGGRREIVIPPDLGYGSQATGPIPGGSTLVFVVDLVGVQSAKG